MSAIHLGASHAQTFHVGERTVSLFGDASEDRNPLHFDEGYAAGTPFGGRIAHGMLTAAFISAVLGNDLPGHGTVYLGQSLRFRAPVRIGDDVRVVVTVAELAGQRPRDAAHAGVRRRRARRGRRGEGAPAG